MHFVPRRATFQPALAGIPCGKFGISNPCPRLASFEVGAECAATIRAVYVVYMTVPDRSVCHVFGIFDSSGARGVWHFGGEAKQLWII
mmetsp:Transcript_129607/g.252382  ORF Transcript_129607/g.252382 Transcript_129607/m.252382 type:complete len:88 (+) Transcript_129607:1784-2047(+)